MQNLTHENNFTPIFILMQIKLFHVNIFEHGLVLKSKVKVNSLLETVIGFEFKHKYANVTL